MTPIKYRTADVDGFKIFYREAGPASAPKLLLLHGFPSAGHMFRDLIPLLADRFHMVAPDLPGFGQSDMPAREKFKYTFENIAAVIGRFTEVIGFDRFSVYVFDYGAPTGFRLALRHPERITAIISQNGNAYQEGLSDGWTPIQAYWEDPSQAKRNALRAFLTPETTHWQYTHGVPDPTMVSPDGHNLDDFYLARSGADEIQLDLLGDYKSNVALYPSFQEYFRTHQPPFLAVWGKNDPFFFPQGAEAFRRDIPQALVRFLDTGHFAIETHASEIAESIRDFLTESSAPRDSRRDTAEGAVSMLLGSRTATMKRRLQRSKTRTKAVRWPKVTNKRTQSVKAPKRGRQGGDLEKTLSLIRAHPGIRPSELNQLLNREQSDGLRSTLIKRGLIRKERDGSAMRYYSV